MSLQLDAGQSTSPTAAAIVTEKPTLSLLFCRQTIKRFAPGSAAFRQGDAAITPDEIPCLPKHYDENLSEREPYLQEQLFSELGDETGAAQDRKVLRAETKLARFLLLARRQLQNRRPVIDLPMTRLDIADYLAMAIKTVSRIITGWLRCDRESRAFHCRTEVGALAALSDGELHGASFRKRAVVVRA